MSLYKIRDTRAQANAATLDRISAAEPVLIDVRPGIDVIPGMVRELILTSGASMAWEEYEGGQRNAILGGALYEGLATDASDADAKLRTGEIRVEPCHDHGCVGSMAGIYTASMPVFVVENRTHGNRAFCNIFEGPGHKRLNYGVYNEEVRRNLLFIQAVVGPVIAEAIRATGGISLRPIMRRALHMGDELHSRNTAASLLFTNALFSAFLDLVETKPQEVRQTLGFLRDSNYFFLRLSMAASKVTADAAHGIAESSIVTAMTFNWRDFSIRISGLGNIWFSAPIPRVEAKLFEGYTDDDIAFMGGESIINECMGLGGFAQAAAFPLQAYSGGSTAEMVRRNLAMYEITLGEHPEFQIPFFGFRGTPIGIDIQTVVDTGVTPTMNIGVAHKGGGQIGAGVLNAPLECFRAAATAYQQLYDHP